MTAINKTMVVAGIVTLFQAAGQMLFTSLALLQYFCVIDFLRQLPLLLFIRILYFHNPNTCGERINIGPSIDGMADSAFILLTRQPFTATRTFIINSASLGLSVLWLLTCIGLMRGGAKNKQTKPIRWPWIIVTSAVCGVDLVATVTYANDSFHTRTLSDMMEFIGGSTSGTGNTDVNTAMASWIMVILYSRFIILFFVNLFLIVGVVISVTSKRFVESTAVQVEAQTVTTEESSRKEEDVESLPSETPTRMLPRPGIRYSYRRMKARLFSKTPSPAQPAIVSIPNSLESSPERSPQPNRVENIDTDKKRTVNFPKNLLSLPQRLENLIAEQRKRLDRAVVDTAGRQSPPRASQSLPHLASTSTEIHGRRDTAAELQGQLPWAYIPASAHPMRHQLPPDEDLPPVPLPDYTAISTFRKASVHRAASSLSSLTHKKEKSQIPRPPLTHSDVLY